MPSTVNMQEAEGMMETATFKVLMVDDDQDDFLMTRDLLRRETRAHYEFDWESQYESGLARLCRGEHDVALVDYRLGPHTGLELLHEAIRHGCNTPIILLTGQGDREIDQQALNAGAADYLSKSNLSADLLERSIRYSVHQRRWEEQRIQSIGELVPFDTWTFSPDWAATAIPEDQERVQQAVRQAMEKKCDLSVEFRALNGSNRVRWLAVFGRMLFDAEGRAARLAGVTVDITERKRAEEELKRHRERLEELVAERTAELRTSLEKLRHAERLASVGTLAAGIAHEINNPLNCILITAECALRFNEVHQWRENFTTIRDEALRGGRIIKNVLKFAREGPTDKSPMDINQIVRRAVDLTRSALTRELRVDLNLSESLPPVPVNEIEIEQVVVNLVRNAMEAAETAADVSITTAPTDGAVRLIVADRGPGIPQEHLKFIFDPFYSTRKNSGGTGLGLSICHGIIEEHGGSISAESRPGEGATFTIQLPTNGKLK